VSGRLFLSVAMTAVSYFSEPHFAPNTSIGHPRPPSPQKKTKKTTEM